VTLFVSRWTALQQQCYYRDSTIAKFVFVFYLFIVLATLLLAFQNRYIRQAV
jgi:hypothetical protein